MLMMRIYQKLKDKKGADLHDKLAGWGEQCERVLWPGSLDGIKLFDRVGRVGGLRGRILSFFNLVQYRFELTEEVKAYLRSLEV